MNNTINFIHIDIEGFLNLELQEAIFFENNNTIFIENRLHSDTIYMISIYEFLNHYSPNRMYYREPTKAKATFSCIFDGKIWHFWVDLYYHVEQFRGVGKDGDMDSINLSFNLRNKMIEIEEKINNEFISNIRKHQNAVFNYDTNYSSLVYSYQNFIQTEKEKKKIDYIDISDFLHPGDCDCIFD